MMFIAFFKLAICLTIGLVLQTPARVSQGMPCIRIVNNTWNSSSTHGRLISYLVWAIPQHTVCVTCHAGLCSSCGGITEEKQLMFLRSLSWLRVVIEQSEWEREIVQVLSGQEEHCLSRKQKGNVWTKMVGVRVCVGDSFMWISDGMCDGMAHNCTRHPPLSHV